MKEDLLGTFSDALSSGEFVVTTELNPPKGTDLGPLMRRAESLSGMVRAFNVTDSAGANMTMAPIAAAHLMIDRGVEPILQVTGRDRNRIALEGEILAAAALGIRNVLCMSGDPPGRGDHPDAKGVFDLKAETLLEAVTAMKLGQGHVRQRAQGDPCPVRRRCGESRSGRRGHGACPDGGQGALRSIVLPDAGGVRRRVFREIHGWRARVSGCRCWRG